MTHDDTAVSAAAAETTTRGRTADGVGIEVRHRGPFPSQRDEVWVDGERVEVARTDLYRDGGTRTYETTKGVLTLPHKTGSDDRTPRWTPFTGGGPS